MRDDAEENAISLDGLAVGVDDLAAIVVFRVAPARPNARQNAHHYARWVAPHVALGGDTVDARALDRSLNDVWIAAVHWARSLEPTADASAPRESVSALTLETSRHLTVIHAVRAFGVAAVFDRSVPIGLARAHARAIARALEHELPYGEAPQPDSGRYDDGGRYEDSDRSPDTTHSRALGRDLIGDRRHDSGDGRDHAEDDRSSGDRSSSDPGIAALLDDTGEAPLTRVLREERDADGADALATTDMARAATQTDPSPRSRPSTPAPRALSEPPRVDPLSRPSVDAIGRPSVDAIGRPSVDASALGESALAESTAPGPHSAPPLSPRGALPPAPSWIDVPPRPPERSLISDRPPARPIDGPTPEAQARARAVSVVRYIEQTSLEPHIAVLRLALRSGLGLDKLRDLRSVSADQLVLFETAAEEMLGLAGGQLRERIAKRDEIAAGEETEQVNALDDSRPSQAKPAAEGTEGAA